jgi:hypothetical protein
MKERVAMIFGEIVACKAGTVENPPSPEPAGKTAKPRQAVRRYAGKDRLCPKE